MREPPSTTFFSTFLNTKKKTKKTKKTKTKKQKTKKPKKKKKKAKHKKQKIQKKKKYIYIYKKVDWKLERVVYIKGEQKKECEGAC